MKMWPSFFNNNNHNNHRDSLFDLPLMPPAPRAQSGVDKATAQLTTDVDAKVMSFSLADAVVKLTGDNEEVWQRRGEERALALFHAAAQYVPAYKDYLAKHNINPDSVRTLADFKRVPPVDKENYLRAYPLEQLCWHGYLPANQMISVSSGSSGKPFFWPRGQILDAETALEHELFLTSFFELDKYSTLFIVCFAMGMYVAGPVTMNSLIHMGRKGYPVTVVTPGYSPDDVLNIIPNLAAKHDQVVIAGYPPYVKEIIDQGLDRGIKWEDIRMRFLLAGEGFNESWRTYVAQLAGNKSPVRDFLNLYGSADAAVLANETTASIVVRRRIAEDLAARRRIFNDERLPSLLQYHPEHKFFETVGEELIFTATGGIPLIRYNIHDRGGILSRADIEKSIPELKEYFAEMESSHQLWHLPFVYVFGKSDQTAIVYGANVYPENIRKALEEEDIRQYVSGKFTMYTSLDDNKDQRFNIDIECSKATAISPDVTRRISNRIHEVLLRDNSEYRSSNRGTGERTIPIVRLFPGGDNRFQSCQAKCSWTRKNN